MLSRGKGSLFGFNFIGLVVDLLAQRSELVLHRKLDHRKLASLEGLRAQVLLELGSLLEIRLVLGLPLELTRFSLPPPECRRECRVAHASAGFAHESLMVVLLFPPIYPRLPATRKIKVDHPPHQALLHLVDARLLLSRELGTHLGIVGAEQLLELSLERLPFLPLKHRDLASHLRLEILELLLEPGDRAGLSLLFSALLDLFSLPFGLLPVLEPVMKGSRSFGFAQTACSRLELALLNDLLLPHAEPGRPSTSKVLAHDAVRDHLAKVLDALLLLALLLFELRLECLFSCGSAAIE